MLIADLLDAQHKRILRPQGGCHNCPRRRIDFVPYTAGPPGSKVIFVGEAPGEEETKQGEGFVGRSGQLLRSEAQRVGILQYGLTNTIHCRPPNNANPQPKEIECCQSQFVLSEIRDYPIVVLCGGVALAALFPGAQMSRFRGNLAHHPDFPGQRFYTMHHPARILRQPDLQPELEAQMNRLGRIVAGEPPPEWKVYRGGGPEFDAVLRKVLSSSMLSLDIETNRLESWTVGGRIRSIALTADALEVVAAHDGETHWNQVLQAVRHWLEQKRHTTIGHNLGFDLDWLEYELNFKVQAEGKIDTSTIYYEAKQYKMPSLKELVSKELDGYRYLVFHPHECTDVDLLLNYNAEDVVYPIQLVRKGMQILKPAARDLVVRVSGPSGYILRKITTTGIQIREEYRQQKIQEYQQKRREALAAWKLADPEFIPTVHESGNGLLEYLFKLKKLPILAMSDGGKEPSTDKTVLKQYVRDGATYLTHLETLRTVDKMLSTYLTAYDKHLDNTFRIHSDYTNTYTDSGRTSSRKPNLQNIARLKEIRDLFGVPPGSLLLESDLSQIEFRIMVALARDENGIAAYLRGEDAHKLTAKAFAPNPTDEQRTWAKAVNFCLIYGGDAYKVQQFARDTYDLDWTMQQADEFTRAFFRIYPGLIEFHKLSGEKLTRNRGWFESVTGHTFYYPDWNSNDTGKRDHAYRSALNAEAQGPAAQACLYIMIHADRLFYERKLPARIVNTVHDSMLTEIGDAKALPDVVATIDEARVLAYEWVKPWLMVPMLMDHKVGESWGSLEKYKMLELVVA